MDKNIDEIILQYVNNTNTALFISGKAGTGKTTLLKKIVNNTHKNHLIVAPTGIAALNAGGVTIHSQFHLPFTNFLPIENFSDNYFLSQTSKFDTKNTLKKHFHFNSDKKKVIRSAELLIIDEVSMLRADLLDAIDFCLRFVRNSSLPFGGIQVVFFGDLYQLPPVVKQEDWSVLNKYYTGVYFYNAHVFSQIRLFNIELRKIYRQTNIDFINLLERFRNNTITDQDVQLLNQRLIKDVNNIEEGNIILLSHNNKAQHINENKLQNLQGKSFYFEAEVIDDFPENIYPIDRVLELKVGTQIMFVKNDISFDKNFHNGKIGIIHELHEDSIKVKFPDDKKIISVEKYEWQNIRYKLNESTREIEEELLGTFVQYPIRLAWAITIHKSQGLTFDKATLDISQTFAPGQVYVALSRLTSLEGLSLLNKYSFKHISFEKSLIEFSNNTSEKEFLLNEYKKEKRYYLFSKLATIFDFRYFLNTWKEHFSGYPQFDSKSIKSNFTEVIKRDYELVEELASTSKKFSNQLQQILSIPEFDTELLFSRINKAMEYFSPKIDLFIEDLYKIIFEVSEVGKSKVYLEELIDLLELNIDVFQDLVTLPHLVRSIINDEPHQNTAEQVSIYKKSKIAKLKPNFDEERLKTTSNKKKREPLVKVSTQDQTLQLLKEGKSIKEISEIRKFSESTIISHICQLLEVQKLNIEDFLDRDIIHRLNELNLVVTDKSLSEIKDQIPFEIGWNEIKLYRASFKK